MKNLEVRRSASFRSKPIRDRDHLCEFLDKASVDSRNGEVEPTLKLRSELQNEVGCKNAPNQSRRKSEEIGHLGPHSAKLNLQISSEKGTMRKMSNKERPSLHATHHTDLIMGKSLARSNNTKRMLKGVSVDRIIQRISRT